MDFKETYEVTKIINNGDTYNITINDVYSFNYNIDQINQYFDDNVDVKRLINRFERIKKINKIMNINNKIYKDIIYKK